MLKLLDLFSGIGGFSLGLERTGGFETVAFCEIDPFCQKVLRKHWPGVPVYSDVRMLRGYMFRAIDIITGGYPCQPFSYAGKRGGEKDNRHLWPQMFRLIQECRPRWVFAENVAGHITMGLDEVLSDLEGEGYTSQAFVIPACATDAPHRRERVWVLANSNGIGRPSLDESCKKRLSGVTVPRLEEGCVYRPNNLSVPMGRRYNNPRSGVVRNDDGLSSGVDRLRSLGNAVVPQIPEIIGRAILQAEAGRERR